MAKEQEWGKSTTTMALDWPIPMRSGGVVVEEWV
jgi:hypothetical protein